MGTKLYSKNLNGRAYLIDVDVDGMILRLILWNDCSNVWTGFDLLKLGFNGSNSSSSAATALTIASV
jgi:hypothetical protein